MLVESQFFVLPGLRMHALVCGDSRNPPAVFLHGFPEYSESWREILEMAARSGLYAVAPDLRGYGQTDKPRAGYDLSTLAGDIAALIARLGGSADVVGHDWGGGVAYQLAAYHPERVKRLCVVNCPHPRVFIKGLRRLSQLRRSWYMGFFQIPWLPEWLLSRNHGAMIPQMIRRASVHPERMSAARLQGFADNFADPRTARAGVAYYRAAAKALFRGSKDNSLRTEVFPRIPAPFRLVWCEEDVALGRGLSTGYEPYFTHPVEVRYIPDVGHFGSLEAPEKVGPLVLEHLVSRAMARPDEGVLERL